jgi:hypothetical protein
MKMPGRRTPFIILILFVAYVTTYVYLARRGMADYSRYGFKGFLYCRSESLFSKDVEERRSAANFHNFCHYFFRPLNLVHEQFDWRAAMAYAPLQEPFLDP